MRFFRFSWRAIILILWVFVGLTTLTLLFPILTMSYRQRVIQLWSKALLHICGVRTQAQGEIRKNQPVLFVANHISWLDIFVINAYRPTVFVAKNEIRRWPFIGWLVAGAGTVFIDRQQRHAIKAVAQQMQQKFSHQLAVGLFPEGTTSAGMELGAFHASLFQTALTTAIDIQPIALRYYDKDRRSARVAFIGEQSLVENIWLLLSQAGVSVRCDFLAVLAHENNAQLGRVAIAKHAHDAIAQVVLQRS